MSRMFKSITRTWPVFSGCLHNCTYCNVHTLATGRLKNHPRYKDWPMPRFNPEVIHWKFKPGEFIFVAYMGDISFATDFQFGCIIDAIKEYPKTDFLLCSKNPESFKRTGHQLPGNIVLGTTIETNRDYRLSRAPPPGLRALHLELINHPRKFISIEPVMAFDLPQLVGWVERIEPDIIEIGADNYHNNLPEPSPEDLLNLLTYLHDICPRVVEKEGLDRLLKR
jgi:hypothetical protein